MKYFPIFLKPSQGLRQTFDLFLWKNHAHAWYVLRYAGRKVILGIDRLDYMKGIPHKLMAFGCFLEHHPDWVTLLQGNVCNKNNDGSSARSGGSKYGVGLGFFPSYLHYFATRGCKHIPLFCWMIEHFRTGHGAYRRYIVERVSNPNYPKNSTSVQILYFRYVELQLVTATLFINWNLWS